jgi:hypothetical protein
MINSLIICAHTCIISSRGPVISSLIYIWYSWWLLSLHISNTYWGRICMIASYRQCWIISTNTHSHVRETIISYLRILDTNKTLMTQTQSILNILFWSRPIPWSPSGIQLIRLTTLCHMICRTWSSSNPNANLMPVINVPC